MPSLSLFISCQNGLKSLWCDLTSNPYKNFCTASALQTQNIVGGKMSPNSNERVHACLETLESPHFLGT